MRQYQKAFHILNNIAKNKQNVEIEMKGTPLNIRRLLGNIIGSAWKISRRRNFEILINH